jgi:hypothetical protein
MTSLKVAWALEQLDYFSAIGNDPLISMHTKCL